MDRRMFLKSAAASFFLKDMLAAAFAAEPAKKPNIVFIFADDLGWSDVGCNGSKYYETPNIDALAAAGMRFTDAYVGSPVCSPSRACLMFGQYPPRTGCYMVGKTDGGGDENSKYRILSTPESSPRVSLEKTCIAQALKDAGYSTAIFGKWHLGDSDPYQPLNRGFEHGFIIPDPHLQSPYGPFETRPQVESQRGIYQTDFLTDEALKFIEKNTDKPFFVYLPYFSSVHATLGGTILPPPSYELTEKYRKKQPDGKDCDPAFAATVERCDYNVGRVVQKIKDLKIDDNTLIIFYSDNGGVGGYREFGDDRARSFTSNLPLRGGKVQLYEGGIRVPLIMHWTGKIKAGSVCKTPVTGVDFYPTFLEIAGAAPRKDYPLDGLSMLPLLSSQTPPQFDRNVFWYLPVYYGNKKKSGVWIQTPAVAVRHGDFKLIRYFEDDHVELYHLGQDIGEKVNLAAVLPEKAKQMQTDLNTWLKNIGAFIPQKLN